MTGTTTERSSAAHRDVAERAWLWVLGQVRWDDGPWIPESVPAPDDASPPWDRDGLHSGIGGLAHCLAEIRLSRPWTAREQDLASAIVDRLHGQVATSTDATFFDGLVSSLGSLAAVDPTDSAGLRAVVARLTALAGPDGWPQTAVGPPGFLPDARVHDATLGTAGVLLGALWARRHGTAGADGLARHAADVLMAEAEPLPTGINWLWVPLRFGTGPVTEMPNFSHGLAGIATALACAGVELGRPDLTTAAAGGAEHLVTLADTAGDGFVVPRTIPNNKPDQDDVTFTWCHGPTGTSLLFRALEGAGVDVVAGESPSSWHRRCLHAVRTSGLPDRVYPGFWDNDGRCCGTAGVGDVFLDSWHHTGDGADLEFALRLADVLLDRAVLDGPHAWWRFVEHRAAEPLLPPGVGWMQGTTGIAAFLFHTARVLEEGPSAAAVPRMDTWWALPEASVPQPPVSGA
jgi:hypothetical protein